MAQTATTTTTTMTTEAKRQSGCIVTWNMADVKDQDFLHETLSSQSKASQNAVRSVSSKSMKFADVEIQSVRSDDTSIFSSLK